MSMFQRLRGIVTGLLMLAVAVTFLTDPSDEAYMVIVLILTVSLLIEGLREIIFYFLAAVPSSVSSAAQRWFTGISFRMPWRRTAPSS